VSVELLLLAATVLLVGLAVYASSRQRGIRWGIGSSRRARIARTWLTDALAGWFIGSAVMAIVGQSVLAGSTHHLDTLSRTIFVILGGILGVAFMRLVRSREATAPRSGSDGGPSGDGDGPG